MKALLIRSWTWITVISLTFLSLFLYFGWVVISDRVGFLGLDISFTLGIMVVSPYVYLTLLLNIYAFLLWEYSFKVIMKEYRPTYETIGKSLQKKGKMD